MTSSRIDTMLVVVRGHDDGEIVLDKAHRLAKAAGASLHLISVAHDDFADLSVHDDNTRREIRTFLCQSGESVLQELVEPLDGQGVDIESACVWHKYEWSGILDVAEQIGADFIIKSTDSPVKEAVRTPSDWNLLRHAEIPVMLVKPINWVESPVVLAAIDATQIEDQPLNERILLRASELAAALSGNVHVVNVYPSVEHWVGPITLAIDFDVVRAQVHQDISKRVGELVRETRLDIAHVHTREGHVEAEIQSAVEEVGAEIMVMGTHHRSGAKGVILGNTSEKILHIVRADVEVIR